MTGFEGSYAGDRDRISDAAKLECGVCWWVYDPAVGDDVWQVPAGTPFNALPAHWRCPNCDHDKAQFMVVDDRNQPRATDRPQIAAGARQIEQCATDIAAAYRNVENRIRSLPVHNAKLSIDAVSFRRCPEGIVGVVATPWCMNIILVATDNNAPRRTEGSKRMVAFPSGSYEFIAAHLDGVGPLESCSLFSPMEEFDDPAVVRLVAEEAMRQLFETPDTQTETEQRERQETGQSRRAFLFGDTVAKATHAAGGPS